MADPVEQARRLHDAVRDGISYDPYVDYTDRETYRASSVLAKGASYCVGKASLYAALCRAVGIPARIGLADVKNHLATPRLLEAVGTDLFAYHGFVEVMPAGTLGEGHADVQRHALPEARRAAARLFTATRTRCCSRSTRAGASSCPMSRSTARSSTCR